MTQAGARRDAGPSPDRLQAYLDETRIDARLVVLDEPARTVAAAARILDAEPAQVLKSLVVRSDGGDVAVVVLAGPDRLDLDAVADALGWDRARMAPPEDARAATGYAIGGTPPVGHARPLPVVVDARAAAVDVGYAGGGRPERLLEIRPRDIVDATGATVAAVTEAGT